MPDPLPLSTKRYQEYAVQNRRFWWCVAGFVYGSLCATEPLFYDTSVRYNLGLDFVLWLKPQAGFFVALGCGVGAIHYFIGRRKAEKIMIDVTKAELADYDLKHPEEARRSKERVSRSRPK